MSEAVKTLVFLAVALIVGGLAYVSRPATATSAPEEEVNQALFPDFTDPLQAESMQITQYDAERGQIRRFEVSNTSDGWQITSKGGYPANATQHMTQAANSLVDLIVLRIVSDLPGQHAEYGVVEPNANAVSSADEGVGQMVTIDDKSDKTLANIIIGAADKEDPQLRYVRVPGRDRVYLVRLDPSVFSTEFSDWIEKDLLQINPFDVASLRFRNYTMQVAGGRIEVLPQMDATVAFDAEKSKWDLIELQEAADGDQAQLTAAKIPAGQQLNAPKLDEIKNSLDDLTIVDVFRKPEQLAEALKKGNGLQDLKQEDLPTLVANGFFPFVLPGEDEAQIVGLNGELVIETQDAIRYRLLFGLEKLGGDNKDEKQQFLFVQTELVDEMLPPPNLQEVPEIKEGEGEDIEAQAKAREKILQENDAAMTAYREKKNAALRKIFDLNTRFADWYYVVKAEDVAKVLLNRNQLSIPINQATTQPSGGPGRMFPNISGGNGMLLPTTPAQPQPSDSASEGSTPAEDTPEESDESEKLDGEEESNSPMNPEETADEASDEGSGSSNEPSETEDSADSSEPDTTEETTDESP